MVSLKRIGAFSLGLFVIVEIILLIIALASYQTVVFLLEFFYTWSAGLVPTLWFWLFFGLGLGLLVSGLFLAYMRFSISYIPAFIGAIMLALVFTMTEYVAIYLYIVP